MATLSCMFFFFFSSRRRHTRFDCDWSSDVCSSDLAKVRDSLSGHAAVLDVHDLHVWALASSTPALTAHVVMRDGTRSEERRVGKGVDLGGRRIIKKKKKKKEAGWATGARIHVGDQW